MNCIVFLHPFLFESNGLLRPANKPVLADAIWILVHNEILVPQCNVQFVWMGVHCCKDYHGQGDGHKSPCTKCMHIIFRRALDWIAPLSFFMVYPDRPSTKDYAHLKCSKGVTGAKVHSTEDMACNSKKQLFLSNKSNKTELYQPVRNQVLLRKMLIGSLLKLQWSHRSTTPRLL